MSEKTVFISYRRDPVGKSFARAIKEVLTGKGFDAFLDVDDMDAGKWEEQILTQVPKRAHFLLLLTPGALHRCHAENDWVRRECLLAMATGRNIVPVAEESVDLTALRGDCPEELRSIFSYQVLAIRHTSFAADINTLTANYIPKHKAPPDPTPASTCPADISRIFKYAPAELIGRETETEILHDAWVQVAARDPRHPHILVFVALGGEGKTSLVAKWAAELAGRGWPDCDGVFAWSFYSQGTREQTAVSSELFLREALIFFGDPEMAESAAGGFEKGQRLAKLVGAQRTLLLLDGMEPLQYSPASPTPGELKDQGLASLLKGLAASGQGLCVLTSRYAVADLRGFLGTTVRDIPLLRLATAAGVKLLKQLGVVGARREFEELVEEVKGHALTLNLLGSYLREAHGGDIRKVDLVRLEEANAEVQGGHAFHVMDAYLRSFTSADKTADERAKGERALALLKLLGLFDRPALADALQVLWQGAAIAGLTEPLVCLTEVQRNMVLARLESARLLTVNRDPANTLISLDAHPLLREYFAKELRENNPEAWRVAHRRLYEHLCATTKEGAQPTLEELQPLYQAVAHGCLAGLEQEAREKVYRDRILRGPEAYSTKKLGAFGSDLGAIACFFAQPWSRVSPTFTEAAQGWLLGEAAVRLRALGRLTEALASMRAGLAMAIAQENWKEAAIRANNLSELELILGLVAESGADAAHAVTCADRSGDAFQRMARRATKAAALHQAGRLPEAEALFREVERMQAEIQPQYPWLYSLRGFQYCDLLLAAAEREAMKGGRAKEELQARCDSVQQRAEKTLKWVIEGKLGLFDIALDHLTLARVALYRALLAPSPHHLPAAAHPHLEQAVSGLRRAGAQDHLLLGLLTRAWQRALAGPRTGPESAQADLDEAWAIAVRGPMPLFLADIHLYRARLFAHESPYPWQSPHADLAEAKRLIAKHGYNRRLGELEDAEEEAKSWPSIIVTNPECD